MLSSTKYSLKPCSSPENRCQSITMIIAFLTLCKLHLNKKCLITKNKIRSMDPPYIITFRYEQFSKYPKVVCP